MADRDGPVRTCIGCRARAPRADLVRFVRAAEPAGSVVARDPDGRMHGRGAWLHDAPACKQQAIKRGAVRRALRIAGNIEVRPSDLDAADGTNGAGHVTKPDLTEEANGSR